ncbi:sodium-dependent transporter [Endozoicomonadaceae bacterium StTr2]
MQFSSRIGFFLAAVGSAVGVGNIWGFPTQAADNGGGAFVLAYLLFSFLLAWPMLTAELLVGRYGRSDPVETLSKLSSSPIHRILGQVTGWASTLTVILIYSFYSIIAGWILCFGLAPVALLLGFEQFSQTLMSFQTIPTLTATACFMFMTTQVVSGGVADGIEKWCSRLMPLLVLLMLALIGFTLSQPGAIEGLKYFLMPDFSKLFDHQLLIHALGQSFFSMSLGVGVMLVYGAYLSRNSNVPLLAAGVAMTDTLVAILAGLLIIPGMFVALHHGIEIHTADGALKSADTLVFDVLPALFIQFGHFGALISIAFFALLAITALTSSVSMLEVPVAIIQRRHWALRPQSSWLVSIAAFAVSVCIVLWHEPLFALIVGATTRYAMPLLSLSVCLFTGWVWSRYHKLQELQQGCPNIGSSWFWKIWPWYIRIVCPVLILLLILFTF